MRLPIRYLLSIAVLCYTGQTLNAQCTASDILIQNVVQSGTQVSGSCSVTFDLSFTMETNNGNKFIFLHAWKQNQYPNYFDCQNHLPGSNGAIAAPEADDLPNAFLNIGIDNSGATPVLLNTYPADPSLDLTTATSVTATLLPDGRTSYIVQNVVATFPAGCTEPWLMVVDFWSSQSAPAAQAHCVSCGLTYALNYVNVTGLANCTIVQGNIVNQQTTALTGTYSVYADVNGDGFLTTGIDALLATNVNFTLAAGVGATTAISAVIPNVNINQDVIVVVQLSIGGTATFLVPTAVCAPLPVTFMSFNAKRVSRTNVSLSWTTATEINNYGFAIQKNLGNNVWETVAFIPSQAAGGNSTSPLTYTFNDLNSYRGVSQYRLRQVDIDGRFKYSEIRSVRGEGQKGRVIVYPNPSFSGTINVVFEDEPGTRDVSLIDMNGRMLRQWKAYTGNTIQIENLGQGMYSLRIVVRETGEQTVEKLIVNGNKRLE